MSERLFCSKPFEWFEVTQLNGRGGVYLCCPSWLDTPIGNLTRDSVEAIWNGEAAREIRRSVLDGSFDYCSRSRCPYLRTRTGPVMPVAAVREPQLRAVIEGNVTRLPFGPKKIICTYDQSCNLSCPSCRHHVIVETAHEDAILNIQRKLQSEALKSAQYLHITGSGDPFGSPYFRRWLQGMRLEDMPQLNWIHLHSNGQLWTPRMWNSIPAPVRALVRSAEISMDAARAPTYALNRRGGDFNKLMRNLRYIAQLRREGPLGHLKISMVVQDKNFEEMLELVRIGRVLGVDAVYFSQLVNWGTFSDAEFRARAVHLPEHPRHAAFLSVLRDPELAAPLVHLGNLAALRRGQPNAARRLLRPVRRLWRRWQGAGMEARP